MVNQKAQKEHTDMFGQKITAGIHYYRLRIDGNFSNDLKLSQLSMERMLFAIFVHPPFWINQADNIVAGKQNNIRGIIERLRST